MNSAIGKPCITICIPLFNGIEYIKDTLISIRQQVYSNWRVIIGVNGHGQDGGSVFIRVKEILSLLQDDRFRLVNLPDAKGVAQADNALIELAETEWIAHLDADDMWHPQKLELQISALNNLYENKQAIDLIATQCQYFGSMNTRPIIPTGLLKECDFKSTNPIVHSSILFKKGAIVYPSEENGVIPQDYAAFLDLLGKGGKFFTIEHPLTLHRIYQTSHFNASGKQNPGLVGTRFWGADYDAPPSTVVSAFYKMPSKFDENQYMNWARMFLSIPSYLILFTEEEHAKIFEEIRRPFADRTRIIILPRSEWTANLKWGDEIWKEQLAKDPENKIHSPDLYKIWYEKKEFVLKAIDINPFNHDTYVWADIGLVRSEEVRGWMPNFARADRIPRDKMLLLQIDPFKDDDLVRQEDGLYGTFINKNRIGGGIQAATISIWRNWAARYDTMMKRYISAGRFIGKDQSIMASMIIDEPGQVLLLKSYGYYNNPINTWFFLGLWLGANSKRFNELIKGYQKQVA
jgi:glycosyltransferase involved in cell wall biosynthesis